MAETRKGFAFNNPDTAANDGWGAIITPDELRYVYGFGNELQAPNCALIEDSVLQWYIDNAVASVERDLNIKLIKRVYKYRDIPVNGDRDDLSGLTEDVDFEFEDPYDFEAENFRRYIYLRLRRRPVISVEKAEFRDLAGNLIVNMKDSNWEKINHEKGSVQFFPTSGTLATLPLFVGSSFPLFQYSSSRGDYPDAYFIDYTAGFKNVISFRKKWNELTPIVGMLSAINMLNDYGDGRSPGLASSSISLSGISESFSTTQSATNALFGARILNFTNQLKEFFKKYKWRYSGFLIGAL